MFWRHFYALWRKNFILYRRNWKGSACELCCPIFLMLIMMIVRLIISKKAREPAHLLSNGYVFYDPETGVADADFFDYEIFSDGTDWLGYCTGRGFGPDRKIIALAPSTSSIIGEVKTSIENTLDAADSDLTVQLYDSREEIMSIIGDSKYEKDGQTGICFGAALIREDSANNDYQVNYIFDDITLEEAEDSNMPNQEFPAVDQYQRKPDEDAWLQYKKGGYTYLQNLISNAILRDRTAASSYISMIYTPMKNSKYFDDDFSLAMSDTWTFFILLIFLAPLYRFTSNSVQEKETKIREAMKIMGLTDLPYWLSWFTYFLVINTIQCVAMILILIPVFEHSNRFLIFLHLWIYGMTMFAFGLFVGAFFSSAKTAAIVATMFFYLSSFISEVVGKRSVSETNKVLASFFPSVAVQLAGFNMLEFESSGVGLNFSNSSELFYNYRFGTCLWMNVISFFVFGSLGLYLENVLPTSAGVRKPLWYPFTKSYWFGSNKKQVDGGDGEEGNKVGHSSEENELEKEHQIDPNNFEEIPENLIQKEENGEFLKIVGLKKKFEQGFLAINNLNAQMYSDQIFALLGHNGAGKTTTINVLCGMMSATSGQAEIFGHDIKTDMRSIRKMMGFCPQHNILFPKLTVREHLSVFADFKGMPRSQVKDEIDQLLKDLNLTSRQHYLSQNLSGGYKRKLSLGIALIGGSKIVFLDEPSSGMDVTARREMWDMLKKYKNDRIIILTTHYMEEADNLGDRIGIMSHGKMLCCGSSDFLKNRFGEGYNLVVVKAERSENSQLESFVLNNIPGSSKVSEVSSEATYLLPKDSVKYFSEFFKRLDNDQNKLGITSYGVSMTTLEEVFLSVEKDGNAKDAEAIENIKKKRTSFEENEGQENYSISKEQIEGTCQIFWLHFFALLIKRFILSKRNYKGFILDLLLP